MAQFNKNTQQFLGDSKTLFEVQMLAVANGQVIDTSHPLPVTLGSDTITITGNVNVGTVVSVDSTPELPVHTHISEIGTSGILDVPYMPIGGNVVISNNTAILVSGNVNATIVNSGPIPVSGNVNATIVNSEPIPVVITDILPELYSFNNFGIFTHRGWTMSDTLIPMLSIRAKSTATKIAKIINYDIGNNNANQSTVGYVWVENATITGSVSSWTSLNTQAEYRFYTDAYGSNTPNGFSGGTNRHAGIIIGKNSSAEEDIKDLDLIANGRTMTLCVVRLDSATKLDLWVAIDLGIYS